MTDVDPTLFQRPAALLQALIRFDTTNPPGNERTCVDFIDALLRTAGITTTRYARDPQRPNLLARLPGRGAAPPLLLYGHVDVVTTAEQQWQVDPFAGVERDGYIWGRGALDMKGGVAMMISAFMRAHAAGEPPAGDILLLILSDEEDGGEYGAAYMVDEHPALFDGVRFAIGEFGGFTLDLNGQRYYPIQVAEKGMCWLELTFRGAGGHGSAIHRNTAMARMGRALDTLDRRRLPVHVTPGVAEMIRTVAANQPFPAGLLLRQLLNPALTDRVLDLLGERGAIFDPLLHNTVNATIVRGGHKTNVVPAAVTVELDGRLLPGQTADDMIRELRGLLGDEVEIRVKRSERGPAAPDMGWFDTLAGVLRDADPAGKPLPLVLQAVTDARHFSRLGIQSYGFLPMQLPPDFNFVATVHAADERIPVAALTFGADAILEAIRRYQ